MTIIRESHLRHRIDGGLYLMLDSSVVTAAVDRLLGTVVVDGSRCGESRQGILELISAAFEDGKKAGEWESRLEVDDLLDLAARLETDLGMEEQENKTLHAEIEKLRSQVATLDTE